jgi:hypothetical protein
MTAKNGRTMKAQSCKGSYLGIARAAMELAEADAKELDQIASDLEAGRDREALAGMREYFHQRKPVDREKRAHDGDREKQQVRA